MDLHISLEGDDKWSGRYPEPLPGGKDGPLATVGGAVDAISRLNRPGIRDSPPWDHIASTLSAVTVTIHPGVYHLPATVKIDGSPGIPVVFRAKSLGEVVFDGGSHIEGWRETEHGGRRAWVCDIPETRDGEWYFKQLFVNGRRARRARLPKEGLFRIGEATGYVSGEQLGWGRPGRNHFRAQKGDFCEFRNLTDVEVVALHYWIEERMPVSGFDPVSGIVTSTRVSRAPLIQDWGNQCAPYYIDNVFEGLSDPGDWYLDRSGGKCWYLPLDGETLNAADIHAPRLHMLLHMKGDPCGGKSVELVSFENIVFRHSEWSQPATHGVPESFLCSGATHHESPETMGLASGPQAAAAIPGAVRLESCRNCSFKSCRFEHLGWYAVELERGCTGIRLLDNEIFDTGAGGIKLNGGDLDEPDHSRTGINRITGNHIHQLGKVFHAGVGILARRTFQNVISCNHIHDLYYTGISVGWVWGYRESVTRENLISSNHIHDVGQGLLSDMGGIYTLGAQPGTEIRGNVIHDISSATYGGWAIYPDEGTSHVLIEDNVCYNTNCAVFHQHYGRENIVRNNIFAFGRGGIVALGRKEEHESFILYRNIIVADSHFIYEGGYGWDVFGEGAFDAHMNILWDTSGNLVAARNKVGGTTGKHSGKKIGWRAWRKLNDLGSIVADPLFKDPLNGDFSLDAKSPAFALGFKTICLDEVPGLVKRGKGGGKRRRG
ncbi:MAG: right-handed parallel beta-helix repeat-containing protein [Victivallales bacterium]|nr:right-handed parallel beta-helix repeat-containing protein [Victivallales bacterium]